MKIRYDASARFDVENVELDVPDGASEEVMIKAMVYDLIDRYNLLYTIRVEKKGE